MGRFLGLAGLAVFLLLLSAPTGAQDDLEAQLSAQVQAAEAAVTRAEAELAASHTDGDGLLAEYDAALERRAALSAEISRRLDAAERADRRIEDVPVILTARRDALYDVITRLYRENADPDRIRTREAELEEVQRRIAEFEAGGAPARDVLDAARNAVDAGFAERDALDARISGMEPDAIAARSRIEAADERLAEARQALQRAREEARIRLNDNPPPILVRVEAGRSGDPAYAAQWVESEREAERLLRLAEFLHADLGRTLPRRQAAVDSWIAIAQADQAAADAALRRYTNLIGGSHDGGVMGFIEGALDTLTGGYGGALVTGGNLTWRKIGIEIGDAAVTVGRDVVFSKVPLHVALGVEAVSQITNAVLRDGPVNPGWDVTQMPHAGEAVRASRAGLTGPAEQAFFEAVTAQAVRASLERMSGQIGPELDGQDFRDRLLAAHGEMTLAAAFSEATAFVRQPDLNIDERPLLGSPLHEWVFSQFTTPGGVVKTLLKEAMFNDPNDRRNLRSVFLDTLQSAVRDGLLEQLERERLEAWSDYMMADIEVQISIAQLRNEGMVRRMDMRIRRILGEEIIPALTREAESLRGQRTLDIETDRAVTGREAAIRLTFSGPVVVDSVTLGGISLPAEGSGTDWTVEFSPGDFEAATLPLVVTARHAAIEDRALDNPETTALWSTLDRRFNGYEPGADGHHQIRLDPPQGTGFAIVLDTSGSMDEDGNGRLAQAQAALVELLGSGRITARDQAALYTFSGCSVTQSVPFTSELAGIEAAVLAMTAGGGTPLAASIHQAASDLSAGNHERGVLIVVTDGEESCDGSIRAALAHARAETDRILRRTVR